MHCNLPIKNYICTEKKEKPGVEKPNGHIFTYRLKENHLVHRAFDQVMAFQPFMSDTRLNEHTPTSINISIKDEKKSTQQQENFRQEAYHF